jgi:hypothetical protein
MKKLMMSMVALMMAMSVNAQYLNDSKTPFEEGKFYVNAAWSGSTLSYSKSTDFVFGIGAKAGYFIIDNLMGVAIADFNSSGSFDFMKTQLGVGARWYFDTVGIYVGGIAKYVYTKETKEVPIVSEDGLKAIYVGHPSFNDFRPEVNAGYTFFLNRNITVEPEAYYELSCKDNDYSGFGVRLGLSIYFNL